MQIYRIETKNGVGVYGRGFGYQCTAAAIAGNSVDPIHPAPCEDQLLQAWWGGIKMSSKKQTDWILKGRTAWRCAFLNIEQMVEWFPRDGLCLMSNLNRRIAGGEVSIVIYEVPHHKVKKGEKQVMFHSEHATFVKRIELDDFLAEHYGNAV